MKNKKYYEGTIKITDLDKVVEAYYDGKGFVESDIAIGDRYSIKQEDGYTYYPATRTISKTAFVSRGEEKIEENNALDIFAVIELIKNVNLENLKKALIKTIKNKNSYNEDMSFLTEICCIINGNSYHSGARILMDNMNELINKQTEKNLENNSLYQVYKNKGELKTDISDLKVSELTKILSDNKNGTKLVIEKTDKGFTLQAV